MGDSTASSGRDRDRDRSRSPRRATKGRRGFRWKDHGHSKDGGSDHGSSGRQRSPHRYRDFHGRRNSRDGSVEWHRHSDRYDERPPDRGRDRARVAGEDVTRREEREDTKKRRNHSKATNEASAPVQEMIIVHINDRLGTKTAVPCLPSDTVGQLKLMIAARIGREAGQIMLRRQGERPFKDMLSLEDYAISNGVQLDLEIDTGD